MKACAYRGWASQAKYPGTYWGKKSIQIANQAAAIAPRTPQMTWDVGGHFIDILPSSTDVRDDAPTAGSARILRLEAACRPSVRCPTCRVPASRRIPATYDRRSWYANSPAAGAHIPAKY